MTSSPDPVLSTLTSYDLGAAEYAEHSRDHEALNPLHQRFRDLVGPGASILELGCGPGHDAAELARLGLNVCGFDPVPGLLGQATRNHVELKGHLLQADARRLPFRGDSFDGAWACASLLHVPKQDIGQAIREAFRTLRPNGVLFTSMQHGDGELVPYEPGSQLPARFYFFYRADEWQELVKAAGFRILDQRVNSTSYGLTADATGWIETFARKP
jgi:ubiquinone/menaquinone biosynthesis C-methylase UbiE